MIYDMFACDLNEWTLAISSRDCMDRPLAVGGASGAITSILLGLSRFYFNTPEIYWEKGIEVANQVCSCASRGFDLEDLPWCSSLLDWLVVCFSGPLWISAGWPGNAGGGSSGADLWQPIATGI